MNCLDIKATSPNQHYKKCKKTSKENFSIDIGT